MSFELWVPEIWSASSVMMRIKAVTRSLHSKKHITINKHLPTVNCILPTLDAALRLGYL